MTRLFHLVEGHLDGFRKIAGIHGNCCRVSGFVREQPDHDLGPGIHSEQRTQGAEQIAGPVGTGELADGPRFSAGPQQAEFLKAWVGIPENRRRGACVGNKQRLGRIGETMGFAQRLPFPQDGLLGENLGDPAQDPFIGGRPLAL